MTEEAFVRGDTARKQVGECYEGSNEGNSLKREDVGEEVIK